jgi:hypothetical protein
MARLLIVLGLVLLAVGLLWPNLARLGLANCRATSRSSAGRSSSIFDW